MTYISPRLARVVGRTCDLEVPIGVDEEVLGLEVAIDDVLLVQVLEDERDLRGVEAALLVLEPPRAAEVREELAPDHVLQHQVQVPIVCKARRQSTEGCEGGGGGYGNGARCAVGGVRRKVT